MSVLTREELMESVRAQLGDDNSDNALALIENISDTFDDYEKRANNDGVDWKKKYEDNDKEWRTKYRDRFFSGGKRDDDDVDPPTPRKLTFESLFKED